MTLDSRLNRRRGGCLAKLFFLTLFMALLAVLCWITLLPFVVARVVHDRTGFDVTIQDLSVNPFTARVSLRGLVLGNPSSYPISDFVQLRELTADLQLASVFTDRLVVEEAVFDLGKFGLVKNSRGERNATAFVSALLGESPAGTNEEGSGSAETPPETKTRREFLIRRMQLRLDQIVVLDGVGDAAQLKTVNLQFSQDYENVTKVSQITAPILKLALQKGGLRALEELGKGGSLEETGRKWGDSIKNLFKSPDSKGGK